MICIPSADHASPAKSADHPGTDTEWSGSVDFFHFFGIPHNNGITEGASILPDPRRHR